VVIETKTDLKTAVLSNLSAGKTKAISGKLLAQLFHLPRNGG